MMWIPVRASDNKCGDMSSILGPAQVRRELTALSCVLRVSHMYTEAPHTRTLGHTQKKCNCDGNSEKIKISELSQQQTLNQIHK